MTCMCLVGISVQFVQCVQGVKETFHMSACGYTDCNCTLTTHMTENIGATTKSWLANQEKLSQWILRKGQKNGKEQTIQRFEDLTGDEESKGWELEHQLSASYKSLMSMCRGKNWCLSPSSSSTILFVYTHGTSSTPLHGDSNQAACDVLFYLLVSNGEPRWLSYWPDPPYKQSTELQATQVSFKPQPFIHISALSL